MTRPAQAEGFLHLLLEIEVLLGGGRQLQSGLPTVLQSMMQAFAAQAIALNLWDGEATLRFDFPCHYGQTALLLRDDDPLLKQHQFRVALATKTGDPTSFLLIPVSGVQARFGMLQLVLVHKHSLAPEMDVVLNLIGRQVGIALENAAAFATLQRQTFELGILSRIGDSLLNLLSTLQIEKVAGRIMNAVKDLLDVEETSILLKDLETGDLILWQHTPPERDLNIRLKRGQGIGGWVLEHARPAIVNDVRQDERWEGGIDQTAHFTTRSLLAVPILVDHQVMGVVEAVNKINGEFTLADEKWL